ncbi:hypothetical protein Tco_1300801 [Tanacetum coccineum]
MERGFTAVLAALIIRASQSRQHGKSEPVRQSLRNSEESPLQGFAAVLAILITRASQSRQHGKSEPVEFRRISLTGFRSCTSRSHYQRISKQTTRYPCVAVRVGSHNSPTKSLFDVSSSKISIFTVNT